MPIGLYIISFILLPCYHARGGIIKLDIRNGIYCIMVHKYHCLNYICNQSFSLFSKFLILISGFNDPAGPTFYKFVGKEGSYLGDVLRTMCGTDQFHVLDDSKVIESM